MADFSYAKTKQEWLSELEGIREEVRQKKIIEIECEKNPAICPIILNSLAIDKNGNIEGVEKSSDLQLEKTSLLEGFTQKLKQALASLGLAVENGIAKVRELFAKNIRTETIEMVDQATGEIYCTWIENGEWVKVKSPCEEISNPNDIVSNLKNFEKFKIQMPNQIQNPNNQNENTTSTEPITTSPAQIFFENLGGQAEATSTQATTSPTQVLEQNLDGQAEATTTEAQATTTEQ